VVEVDHVEGRVVNILSDISTTRTDPMKSRVAIPPTEREWSAEKGHVLFEQPSDLRS